MFCCRALHCALLLAVLVLPSCAPLTKALGVWHEPAADEEGGGYRYSNLTAGDNGNSLFICLAFSGGGTRAAALAYGVMEELRDTEISWDGKRKRLLDEVDCISSVSGGSFTAAYYGLFKDELFTRFRSTFLDRNIQSALIWKVVNPINWPRLASPYFSRIDLAAELYDHAVFDRRRYEDLADAGKPFVVLNATDVANGGRFPFTQDQFDLIGSDLTSYPVARGVAASSAFPFLLSPLTLKNHQPIADYVAREEYRLALNDFYVNRSRFDWARRELEYVDHPRSYVHLLDGGLADNIGLRPITAAIEESKGFIARHLQEIRTLVIVVVNAKTRGKDSIGDHRHTPRIVPTVAVATGSVAMNNYSDETVDFARRLTRELTQARETRDACQRQLDKRCPHAVPLSPLVNIPKIFVVEVNFDAIQDETRRNYFLGLPTSFHLRKEEVSALVDVGHELLEQDPQFQALKALLGR